jgi:hypothetical protein
MIDLTRWSREPGRRVRAAAAATLDAATAGGEKQSLGTALQHYLRLAIL